MRVVVVVGSCSRCKSSLTQFQNILTHTHICTHIHTCRGRGAGHAFPLPAKSALRQFKAFSCGIQFTFRISLITTKKKSRRFDSDYDFSFSFDFDLGLDFELSLTLKVVAVNSIQLWIAFTFVGPSNYHRNGRLKMRLQSLHSTHIPYTLQLQLHEAFSQSSRGYSPLFVGYACKLLLPNDKWAHSNLTERQNC